MTVITCEQLPELFAAVGNLFEEKREELCDMDAKMGDGDLGLTMAKDILPFPACCGIIWNRRILEKP